MDWKALSGLRRRLARERGTIIKDWGGRLSFALVYPNSYHIGMSNLGFQAIYRLLNEHDGIVCERVFHEPHEPISLESQRPLGDFDIVAFSLSYELDYFNAARIIKSGGIPVMAADREERHPLIIAGGPAVTSNPEPLASLFDCFAIGEGEAILPGMLETLSEGIRLPRHELLAQLSKLPGIYVPFVRNGLVVRAWVGEIDDFAATSVVTSPDTEFGDLHLMEIARGCPWGCRFCLAGFHFRPMRPRSLPDLLSQARSGLQHRKRLGLVGAAISDHPQIDELLAGLRGMGARFSVSSLRIRPLSTAILEGLAEGGTRSISLAPEAGSERLRRVINKGISEDDIMTAIDEVSRYGFGQLKLYFIIGLPSETDEDAADIVRLAIAAKQRLVRERSGTALIVNVMPFVPKAGTPFQWLGMCTAEVLRRRLAMINRGLSKEGIGIKTESVGWSLVQGSLARGDVGMGRVIAGMPSVTLQAWRRTMEEAGLDPDLVHRDLPLTERLPWSAVSSGVATQYLQDELEKALHSVETPPCPSSGCHQCGLC